MNGMEEGAVRREPNHEDDYGRSKELGRRMRGSVESRHICRWATATTPGRRRRSCWHLPPPLEEHAHQRSRGGLSSTTKATDCRREGSGGANLHRRRRRQRQARRGRQRQRGRRGGGRSYMVMQRRCSTLVFVLDINFISAILGQNAKGACYVTLLKYVVIS